MKLLTKRLFFGISLISSSFLLFTTPVLAHRSPDACLGSGLSIDLYANPSQVDVGGTITYSVSVFNGTGSGPIVCDATEIVASVTTPDAVVHPITLTRTALSNGDVDNYTDIITYVARQEDMQGTIFMATGHVIGNVHQNDTDSQGGGDQGVNVQYVVTPPPVVVVPPPVVVVPPTSSGGCTSGCTSTGSSGNVPTNPPPQPITPPQYIPQSMPVAVIVPTLPHTGFAPEESSLLVDLARISIVMLVYGIKKFI